MKRSSGAAHVATTRRHYKGKTYETHLVRRTYREDGRVKHQTLANLSHLPDHVIDLVRRSLKGESFCSVEELFEVRRNRPHGHVAAVLGSLRRLGLDRLLATRRSRPRQLVIAMLVERLLAPGSKLATARRLHPETLGHTLAEILGVEAADEDELYAAMDWLRERQGKIEQALAKRHLREGTLVLCDVTSTYLEGRKCPLGRIGYSRDGKKNKLQIVFGLLTSAEGCPVAVEVFEGHTADPTTVADQVRKLRERFALERVVLVGDRGLLTSARLREDLEPVGLDWISALRAPQILNLVRSQAIQLSLFDDRDLAEISGDPAFPGERLVVCYNPLLAEERARKREELLRATERQLDKVAAAVQRPKRALRGKDKIGVRADRARSRFKVGKHFRTESGEDSFCYERKSQQIEEEASLDGLYVIRTSLPAEQLDAEQTVRAYKGLSVIERAFRSFKTIDLKVRPIFHRLEERVRAHVFLCMLAYYVEWHMRQKLAPLLFDDDDPEGKEAKRSSVVAPAQRSDRAERKARTKRTDDGWPVQSFQGLLGDLATLCKNLVLTKGGGDTFDTLTTPTPLQQRAFDLLDVKPMM